jgi:hypothetical protein
MTAAAIERARARRTAATVARFQRLRWRSQVAGDGLAVWLLRQAQDSPRWARGVRYRHRWILQRIAFDAAVGAALAEAWHRQQQRARKAPRASAVRVLRPRG